MENQELTPEQMAEAAKQQCIFCQIASGQVASKKIYEDDKVVAVLDINPANPGHVLLMTKEHYVVMPQIPDDVVAHIGMITKALSHALLRALKAQGTTIFVANGVTAGQRAQHFMLHLIPRMEGDGVGIEYPEHSISDADYKKILEALRAGVAKTLGKVEGLEEETEKEEEMIEEAEEKVKEKEEAEEKEEEKEDEEEQEEEDEDDKEEEEEKEEEPEKEEAEEEEDEERKQLDDIADFLT
jgi:histidine triad (HIT) family protein